MSEIERLQREIKTYRRVLSLIGAQPASSRLELPADTWELVDGCVREERKGLAVGQKVTVKSGKRRLRGTISAFADDPTDFAVGGDLLVTLKGYDEPQLVYFDQVVAS